MNASTTSDFNLGGALPRETVLLEASAGTGKTYTIAHLVVRYVAERGVEIDKLLVVTFTEAATAELRDRIRRRIRDAVDALNGEASGDTLLDAWATMPSDEERELYRNRLERALANFDAAAISTIHGFCSRVLSQAAFESGADYGAELLTNPKALHRDIVFDHLAIETTKLSEAQYESLGKGLGSIKDSIKLLDEVIRNPDAKILPEALPSLEEAEEEARARLHELRDAMSLGAQRLKEELEGAAARDIAKGIWRKQPALLKEAWALLDGLRQEGRPLSASERGFLEHLRPKNLLDGKKKKAWGALENEPILDALTKYLDAEGALVGLQRLRFQRAFVDKIRDELPERKRKLGVLTFDDLLGLVASKLKPVDSPLRSHLRASYRLALIDEFQDTDPIQWAIFRSIFHEGGLPLLLIGDPKQAIYSFRGADIEVYLRAREEAHHRFRLAQNHRSDGPLVLAVNDIFSAFDKSLGEKLAYEPVSAAHEASRLRIHGEPIVPLRLSLGSTDDGDEPAPGISDAAASWAAREVRAFLKSGAEIGDDASKRRIGPRDCAVLVGSNWRAKQVREGLTSLGIPSVLRTDTSVLQSEEAEQLGIWLRAIADPTHPVRLRTALATPLLGEPARTILETRQDGGDKFDEFVQCFTKWASLFARHGLMRALRATVLQQTVEKRFLAEAGGERRITDLWHTAELLHAAQLDGNLDAEELALFLERERDTDETADEARKLRLETDADAVDIVTIHRSKGLEYPVVFCADLYQKLRKAEVPLRYTQDQARVLDLCPGDDAKGRALEEQLEERLRLAYVALTRAKHLCVVHWAMPAKNADRESALDWLLFGDAPKADWKGLREGIASHLSARYAKSEGKICVTSRSFDEGETPRAEGGPPTPGVEAAVYGRAEPLDWRFRWSSYSSLSSGQREDASRRGGSDEDSEGRGEVRHDEGAAEGEKAHLADFKYGTQLGNLLHEVLEKTDFTDPAHLEEAVTSRLEKFGLSEHAKRSHPSLVSDIVDMLKEVLKTPLSSPDGAFCLGAIPARDRVSELDFVFPIGDKKKEYQGELLLRDLERALLSHPRPSFPEEYREDLRRLTTTSVRGLMHGSIDLVFRHAGRYYVVDYKSNHLGPRLSDYEPESLLRAMREKHYLLQAQIYSLALHRHLGQRFKGYKPEEHFGGVFYLFLRGMKEEPRSNSGIYFDRPPKEALLALDEAFTKIGGER